MTLSPRAAAHLERASAAGAPPLGPGADAEAVRQYVAEQRSKVPAATTGEHVHDVYDTRTDKGVPVRIYRPDVAAGAPLVVYFHGGGWILGGLDIHDATCRQLANEVGCVVVNVDYRLAPEHPFPAPFDDCVEATRWAIDHAEELGADARRCAVAGSSAGGSLAAALALTARDTGDIALRAQALFYPALDSRMATASHTALSEGYGTMTGAAMRFYWETYAPDERDREDFRVSPAHADSLAGLPPAIVVCAEYDILRDEAHEYARRLHAEGVQVEVIEVPGQIHGFLATMVDAPEVRAAMERVAAWLHTALA
jgi:acetyl esterase